MSPTRHTPKPKLLLDEGFPPRRSFSKLNQYCDIKHVAHDAGLSGASDEQVYDYACNNSRILVTFNQRDFQAVLNEAKSSMSIIGVSQKMSLADMDNKLTKLVRSGLKPGDFRGKYFRITHEATSKKK